MHHLPSRIFVCCILLGFLGATRAFAHAGEAILPARLAVAEWASALQGRDIAKMSGMLSAGFRGKDAYLAGLPLTPLDRVELGSGTLRIDGDAGTFSPVVIFPRVNMWNPEALSLSLLREAGAWKISAVEGSADIPEEFMIRNHVLQRITQEVKVALRDADTGEPLHARIHVHDESGDYWPPQGHAKRVAEGWREDIGGDLVIEGRNWAYVRPDFTLPLPAGKYRMEVMRGPEYEPRSLDFTVEPGRASTIDIPLKRWLHMAQRGWYSGDTHTHFLSPHSARLEADGEDLNVINVLLSSGGNYFSNIADFTGAPDPVSDTDTIVYVTEETRHDFLGHTVLLNLKELVYPFGWGEPDTGVHGGYDYPTMAQQADRARAQGGVVAWSHMPFPNGELPIDVALGKIDAVEAVVFGNPLTPHRAWNVRGEWTPPPISPLSLWYALLNTGFDVPGLGSTDKMWNSQVAGSVRTYVQVDGALSYQKWVEGIRAGRTFISSNAMIDFRLDGKLPGASLERKPGDKMRFSVGLDARLPLERAEILVNGQIVAHRENPAGLRHWRFDGELEIEGSAWVAARAWSRQELPYQRRLTASPSIVFAHSSPVYVGVNGLPRRSPGDAALLAEICDRTIRWARTTARYHDEAQRASVVALYESGCSVYRTQAAGR
ncbi:MAG: CehA/McbA family metallohydrolase [Gammaproteobacteria bacterium]